MLMAFTMLLGGCVEGSNTEEAFATAGLGHRRDLPCSSQKLMFRSAQSKRGIGVWNGNDSAMEKTENRKTRATNVVEDVERYLSDLHYVLHQVLRDNLTGLYLHGSLAMGAFVPAKSDIDVIATLNRPLNDVQSEELRHVSSEMLLPSAASGLDLTLLTTEVARHPAEDSLWEAPIQVRRDQSGQQAQMRERKDPFLFIDVAVVREHGVIIAGPGIDDSFGPVGTGLIMHACAENCRVWASRDVFHDPASGVLNVCRAWRFLAEEILVSKGEAGEWAKCRTGKGALVETALAASRGDTSMILGNAAVKAFCQRIARLFEDRGFG